MTGLYAEPLPLGGTGWTWDAADKLWRWGVSATVERHTTRASGKARGWDAKVWVGILDGKPLWATVASGVDADVAMREAELAMARLWNAAQEVTT